LESRSAAKDADCGAEGIGGGRGAMGTYGRGSVFGLGVSAQGADVAPGVAAEARRQGGDTRRSVVEF
jgi:hypothetical protein